MLLAPCHEGHLSMARCGLQHMKRASVRTNSIASSSPGECAWQSRNRECKCRDLCRHLDQFPMLTQCTGVQLKL